MAGMRALRGMIRNFSRKLARYDSRYKQYATSTLYLFFSRPPFSSPKNAGSIKICTVQLFVRSTDVLNFGTSGRFFSNRWLKGSRIVARFLSKKMWNEFVFFLLLIIRPLSAMHSTPLSHDSVTLEAAFNSAAR